MTDQMGAGRAASRLIRKPLAAAPAPRSGRVLWFAAALCLLPLWHASARMLSCDRCRQPVEGSYTVFAGKNLHDSCYYRHFARHCHVCGAAIEGQFIVNAWADTVCAVHLGEDPPCEYCGRLTAPRLTGKGKRYKDGREVCGLCLGWTVSDPGQARALLDTAAALLRRHGIKTELNFPLSLVDKTAMAALTPARGREAWGYTGYARRGWLGLSRTERIEMYALLSIPRDCLLGVLAHELMHVWLFTHGPLDMDPVLVEGSCEYAAYLALKDRDGPLVRHYLQAQEANDDLLYGGGYRAVRRFVAEVGIGGWLDYLRSHSAAPW